MKAFAYGGNMNTIDRVKKMVAEQLCLPVDDIADDADIMQLGADSIDVVEMLTTLEDEYGITIPDDKVEQLRTITSIAQVIDEIRNKKS